MANLSYLFECHLNDGTIIFQSPEDVSAINPEKSSFFDVAQRLDEVEVFGLVNNDHTYSVDLRDGHFEIDGLPFDIHSGDQLPTHTCKFRLIYFRRHCRSVSMGYVDMEDHTVAYHFGWQTTIDGKNYQQTISIR